MSDFFFTWSRQNGMIPLPVEWAEGDEFVLADGRRVYDFVCTSFQANFGHSHAPIMDAIWHQVGTMPIASPKAVFPLKQAATAGLLELLDLPAGRIFYTVSGAESVENALKIARRITGRTIVLARQKSYHGATLGAMSVSGDWRGEGHVNFTEGTVRIPEPDDDPQADQVREIVRQTGGDRIAAIIVETVTGTNGVYLPPPEWFAGLRKICDENGILLIADEVLAGFGRCGSPFAFQHYSLVPDMVCMSKGISGGYVPFGAVWVGERWAGYFEDRVLSCGLTSYSHPLGLAALSGVLATFRDPAFRANLRDLEGIFSQQMADLQQRYGASALRCRGLLAAIEFGSTTLPGWDHFVRQGLYLFTKANMMILAPPLTSRPERLEQAFHVLKTSLDGVLSGAHPS